MVLMYLKNKTDPKENVLLLNILYTEFHLENLLTIICLLVISSKIEKDIK